MRCPRWLRRSARLWLLALSVGCSRAPKIVYVPQPTQCLVEAPPTLVGVDPSEVNEQEDGTVVISARAALAIAINAERMMRWIESAAKACGGAK